MESIQELKTVGEKYFSSPVDSHIVSMSGEKMCERHYKCLCAITNAFLCAITGAQRKRVAHWTVDLVDAEWRVCE